MAETEFKYDVFLSHNGKDKPAVEHIARLLRDTYSLKVWLDKWNLVPGEAWQEALEDALDECQTFAVFLGPSGIGPWENEEMRSAIEERVQDKNRRVIPVLLPGAPDNKDLKLPRFLRRATWVDFRSGLDDEEALYRLYCGITGQAPGDRGKPETFKPSNVQPENREAWHLAHPYPMPPNFTGRATELQMLDDWLAEGTNRLFILRALGGFGKSALTWQWINTHVNPVEWTRVIWWSFYEGDASFEHFIEETLKYLNLEVPQGGRPQVDALLKAMQSQKIILIMDGFERALRAYSSMNAAYQGDDAEESPSPASGRGARGEGGLDCVNINAEIFLKNVCSLPNIKSKVLMTTRLTPRVVKPHGEFMLGCREVELTSMQPADAVEFFRKQKIKGTHAEIEAACAPYGYHPLSLRILAGLVMNDRETPSDILVTEKLDITDDIIQNKNYILKVAYEALSFSQQKLLSNIACLRSPTGYQVLKYISSKPSWKRGKNKPGTRENLDEDLQILENHGLLHWDRKINKYDLHPIVRRYAYERLTTLDHTTAHTRLRDYFATAGLPENVQNLEDLAPVIELYHHTVRAGELDKSCELLYERLMKPIYFQFGAYLVAIELLVELFPGGDDKPPHLKRANDQAWAVSVLSSAYAMSGQPIRSVKVGTLALELVENERDETNIPIALVNLGRRQMAIGALAESEHNHRHMIEVCKETQEENHEGTGHYELGRVLSYIGKQDEAHNELNMAEQIKKDNHHIQALTIISSYRALHFLLMARVNPKVKTSNLKSSIQAASHALELSESGDPNIGGAVLPSDLVRSCWLLGAAYCANGDLNRAEENLSKALSMCRQINMVEMEAEILLDLARLSFDYGLASSAQDKLKHFEQAKSHSDEALLITERCGYVLQGADVNLFLAQYALEHEQDKAKAKAYAETALKLAACDGPPYYYKVAYEEAERMLQRLKDEG